MNKLFLKTQFKSQNSRGLKNNLPLQRQSHNLDSFRAADLTSPWAKHTNSSELEHQTRVGGTAGTAAPQNNCAGPVLASTAGTEISRIFLVKIILNRLVCFSPGALLACNMPAAYPRILKGPELLARQTRSYRCGTAAEDSDSCVSFQRVLRNPRQD